jgi:hypothetical protein
MTQLVIQLDDNLASDLEAVSVTEHVPQDLLVTNLVRRWLDARWLKRSQERNEPLARAAGYETEEDILRELS